MSHAWRPLIVIISLVVLALIARTQLIPADFKAKGGDYKYQWHREGNEEEWKNFPVKHKGREFCEQCHSEMTATVKGSGHTNVQCESCHVQFNPEKKGHPIDLKSDFDYLLEIGIDRSRDLCKRCHTELPYRPKPKLYIANREHSEEMKLINPEEHNPGIKCVMCHDVHKTGFKGGE